VTRDEFISRRQSFWKLLCLVGEAKGLKEKDIVAIVPASPELMMTFGIL
jgi:hypothetical protein